MFAVFESETFHLRRSYCGEHQKQILPGNHLRTKEVIKIIEIYVIKKFAVATILIKSARQMINSILQKLFRASKLRFEKRTMKDDSDHLGIHTSYSGSMKILKDFLSVTYFPSFHLPLPP